MLIFLAGADISVMCNSSVQEEGHCHRQQLHLGQERHLQRRQRLHRGRRLHRSARQAGHLGDARRERAVGLEHKFDFDQCGAAALVDRAGHADCQRRRQGRQHRHQREDRRHERGLRHHLAHADHAGQPVDRGRHAQRADRERGTQRLRHRTGDYPHQRRPHAGAGCGDGGLSGIPGLRGRLGLGGRRIIGLQGRRCPDQQPHRHHQH